MAKPSDRRPEVPPLGEVLEFMRLLWAVDHGLQSTSKRMRTMMGVTGPQRLVVRIVGRVPGISAGAIAEVLHDHPSTLTGVLARLERRGLIRRKSDARDRRRALFELTPAGREVDRVRTGTVEAVARRVLAGQPPGRVAAARAVLAALAKALQAP